MKWRRTREDPGQVDAGEALRQLERARRRQPEVARLAESYAAVDDDTLAEAITELFRGQA